MTESERIYSIYKSFGITNSYIEEFLESFSKTSEPPENAFPLLRFALASTFCMPNELRLEDYAKVLHSNVQDKSVKQLYQELHEVIELGAKYRDCKISGFTLLELVDDGIKHGLTRKAALLGVKLGLAHEFGKHEYFTAEDVGEIFGMSTDEAQNFMTEEAEKGNLEMITISNCPIIQ